MPVHDWTRVGAGTFHHFHGAWISEMAKTLNGGLLPSAFYALAEQVAGEITPDILTLHAGTAASDRADPTPQGMTAVAEAPPKVSFTANADEVEMYAVKSRTLVIRHVSGDEIVAFVEILSPGNKNRQRTLDRFLDKAVSVIRSGYHLLLIDLHPPGLNDPEGMSTCRWKRPTWKPMAACRNVGVV